MKKNAGLKSLKKNLKDTLKIYQVNAQCLKNKTEELEITLKKKEIDVAVVVEHWATAEEIAHLNTIDGYVLTSYYGRQDRLHGGTAIYVKEGIRSKEICVDSYEMDCELSCVEVTDENIIILGCYRSDKGNKQMFIEGLAKALDSIAARGKQIICCGDYNYKFNISNKENDRLINLFLEYDMILLINEPTRGKNCLDNAFTNISEGISYKISGQLADHVDLLITVETSTVRKTEYIWRRTYTEEQILSFLYGLVETGWQEIFIENDINTQVTELMQKIQQNYEECFPLKRVNNNKKRIRNKPWYTKQLKEMHENILMLFDLKQAYGSTFEKVYAGEKNKYRKALKNEKKKYYSTRIKKANNKGKEAWKIINSIRGKKCNNDITIDPEQVNNYFISSVKEVASQIKTDKKQAVDAVKTISHNASKLKMFGTDGITATDILKIIKSLKNSDSKDIYGLSVNLLKKMAPIIIEPLTFIINRCLREGIFPEAFKISRVVPVYKKGDPSNVSNYRPVAIIPVIGKILEKIINKDIQRHFERNCLFSNEQYAYRDGRSTVGAVQAAVENIIHGFENKESTMMACCDLTKAFDLMPHDVFEEKAGYYNIEGDALAMLKSYDSGRKQHVVLKGIMSSSQTVELGVGQGTHIGATAFIIHKNDLASYLKQKQEEKIKQNKINKDKKKVSVKCISYADDDNIIVTCKDEKEAEEVLNQQIVEAKNWFDINGFSMNKEKTQIMNFSLRNEDSTQVIKFLGFYIDNKLSWKQHILQVEKKLSSAIYIIYKLKKYLDNTYLKMAYHATVESRLNYGILLWGHVATQQMFIKQKKVIRILAGKKRNEHCKPLFKELKILTLYNLYIYSCLKYIKLNEATIKKQEDIHKHDTRNKTDLIGDKHRLNKSKVGFGYLGISMFNKLKGEIKNLDYKEFCKVIKDYLLENPYYSVKEYFEDMEI